MKSERQLLIDLGYDQKDVDQMTDEEVSEEIAEIPYLSLIHISEPTRP